MSLEEKGKEPLKEGLIVQEIDSQGDQKEPDQIEINEIEDLSFQEQDSKEKKVIDEEEPEEEDFAEEINSAEKTDKSSFVEEDDHITSKLEEESEVLTQDEISICNTEAASPEVTQRISNTEIRLREKKEQEAKLRFQIPPDYQLCLQNWKTSSIQYSSQSRNQINQEEEIKERPEEEQEEEEQSVTKKTKPPSILTNPLTLKGFGTAIPLYYLFILCCMVILIEAYIPLNIIGSTAREAYCQIYKELNPTKSCSIFDIKSYQFTFLADSKIDRDRTRKLGLDLILNKFPYFLAFYLLIFFTIFFFYWIQVKIQQEYLMKEEESHPSEFTVMVEGVYHSE